MRTKKDFYDTPIFAVSDHSTVESFCDPTDSDYGYFANIASQSLNERIVEQLSEEDFEKNNTPTSNSTSLTIFPNPATAEFTLRATGGSLGNITIYDTSGRPVMQANAGGGVSEHRMDIGALAPGIYIVQAACGDEVHAEKLVVAR